MIRMCGVRLVDRVSTDVLRDRMGVAVKIEDMIIQSCLQWYGCDMHGDINSQIHEVMEVEITGKRKKGWQRKSWEECIKKGLEQYSFREERMHTIKRNGKSKLEPKLLTLASCDNGINFKNSFLPLILISLTWNNFTNNLH